ncbi:hypothetical protein FDP41_004883 [Naegleria fowleri]|uniref:RRM domain-containing protein n=1 Tax=Naegleria fowleri TaxID=5763 RepID=A0A6A5BPS6_NAEFO|nr:uncharacterized protein FDP41_004883 [Naegleria fowleri]KAF0976208.1 hypothetical protein FDP41_004883 [Naegleria fowleri]
MSSNNSPSSPPSSTTAETTSNSGNTNNTNSVDSPSGLRHRIFAGNLDFKTTKEQLYEAFSKCGKIVDEIRLHPGYAFIQFDNEESCLKAIATLSGTQLCSKRIDVQMAKGPNNSQKKNQDNKRKLDSRDRDGRRDGKDRNNDRNRDGRNNNKKTKRDHIGNVSSNTALGMDSNQQRSLSVNPLLSTVPTISPYSTASSATSVPIYIPNQSLEKYANFVLQTLKSNGLMYYNVHIRNTNQGEYFFATPQFFQMIANERYVICVTARHEEAKNIVSFKAIMQDGTSPGFADTSITDVCSFILNSSQTPVVVPSVYQQYNQQFPTTLNTQPSTLAFPGTVGMQPAMLSNTLPSLQQQPLPSTSFNTGNNTSNRSNQQGYHNNNRSNRQNNNRQRNDNFRNNNRSDRGNNNNTSSHNSGMSNTNNTSQPPANASDVQGIILALLDNINSKKQEASSASSPTGIMESSSASTTEH